MTSSKSLGPRSSFKIQFAKILTIVFVFHWTPLNCLNLIIIEANFRFFPVQNHTEEIDLIFFLNLAEANQAVYVVDKCC